LSAHTRYARQMVLPEVGVSGQARLSAARVLVVGAGGLGCPVLQYLAAAGVGTLCIIDPDRVDESNLHRQPLYRMGDLGALKVEAARAALLALNPTLTIGALPEKLTPANVARCLERVDLVIDAADSFAVTYILSDACLTAGKPLVSASVLGWSGYAGVFCGSSPSYRAVFPELPERAGSCALNGVLGSAVGVLGTLQAQLALSMLLGIEPSVAGRVVTVELRRLHFGGFSFRDAIEPPSLWSRFIDVGALDENDIVVDLREASEAPVAVSAQAIRRSTESLLQVGVDPQLPRERRIVLCCRTGLRAWGAARALARQGYGKLALVALGP
jgi:molybdopterin/thiamine biosynthesis adenylyltransferase/rhodanese-related sulfurtransferase